LRRDATAARSRAIINPDDFASRVGHHLSMLLIGARVDLADKALALIARDIAKRRKALARERADYQREQRRLRRFISGG
jgi:hypothetical protein